MWESLIAVYGNRNSGERLPSGCTMDRIDFIDPKRLTAEVRENPARELMARAKNRASLRKSGRCLVV